MKMRAVRTKLYKWTGPVTTGDTIFATPVSLLPFQRDSQAAYRFFSWLVVEVETDEGQTGNTWPIASGISNIIISNTRATVSPCKHMSISLAPTPLALAAGSVCWMAMSWRSAWKAWAGRCETR